MNVAILILIKISLVGRVDLHLHRVHILAEWVIILQRLPTVLHTHSILLVARLRARWGIPNISAQQLYYIGPLGYRRSLRVVLAIFVFGVGG